MKNLLSFLLSVLLLTSCSDVLDKKITKETIPQDMQEIREKYADVYTEKDYDAVAGYLIGAVLLSEKKILDKTYREVLDESKAKRIAAAEQYKKDLQAYEEQIKAAAACLDIEVMDRNAGSDAYNIRKWLSLHVKITNKSTRDISAFRLLFETKDAFDKFIQNLSLENSNTLKSGAIVDDTYSWGADFGEAERLIRGDVSKLNITPVITEIIFTDGTKIAMPDKPVDPDAE
jgi:hypothetical protein